MALVQREPAALSRAQGELANQVQKISFAQFLLFRQGARLREHARANGIRIIGDLPFFVSPDSSDVWAHPQLFLLDEQQKPRFVAGVPPDYFSAQGQLWGNPVYNWEAFGKVAIAGASTACGRCCLTSTWFAWTISARLPRRGMCRRRQRRPKPATGCQVPARISSPRHIESSAAYRSLLKIWDLSRRTFARYAISSIFLGRASCSLRSTAIPTTRICRTTMSQTRWCIPARTTIHRAVRGMKSCRVNKGRTLALSAVSSG